jgi:hypothetical protein
MAAEADDPALELVAYHGPLTPDVALSVRDGFGHLLRRHAAEIARRTEWKCCDATRASTLLQWLPQVLPQVTPVIWHALKASGPKVYVVCR